MTQEERLVKALQRSIVALDDWLNIHAADHCDPERVKAARERCRKEGTLAYIADVQRQNRAALAMPAKQEKVNAVADSSAAESKITYDLVRADGRLERFCEHGVGHTVGHLDPSKLKSGYIWIHGCDGCCANYEKMSDK